MNNHPHYAQLLYPFQDEVLKVFRSIETEFYLTGGTAASRGYLHHRYSDDLDFFVNDSPQFSLWVSRIVQRFVKCTGWSTQVALREERYGRLILQKPDLLLKIELINDVPARVGRIVDHPILGHLDSAENILANKVTALLDREEPKDLADIWAFCTQMNLDLLEAITNAESKAAGIFPADLARLLCSATEADWNAVRWIHPPPLDRYLADLNGLGEKILIIKPNV